MTRVDAHHHLWPDPSPSDYPWMTDELAAIRRPFGPADLAPLIAAAGIDRTVLVQTRSSVEETEAFLAIAAGTSFIAGVVGWLDLAGPGIADGIARLRAMPGGSRLAGIRHQVHDEPDPDWLRQVEVRRGIAAVGAAGLAYDLLVRTRELPAALDTVRALPDVRFVIDHLAKPPIREGAAALAAWSDALHPFAPLPNAWAKVSGLVTEAEWAGWTVDDLVPVIRVALEVFGPDRLLFGSDWPVCLLAASYERVVGAATDGLAAAGLADDDVATVFGSNAIEFYRLDVGGAPGSGG
jgi:L-fuconolactonase